MVKEDILSLDILCMGK